MNKLYFGDNLDILRKHPPRRTDCFYDKDRFGTEYPNLQILTIEALMSGMDRLRFPGLTLVRATFKRAAVEDMGAEQGKLL